MRNLTLSLLVVMLASMCGLQTLFAQGITTPKASPKAIVMQELGISKVKVVYHRPYVKERALWGELVPFGQVWRAGANDNTVVWFSDDVKIEGKNLKAGSYGLHMIPKKEETIVIFSTNSSSWGSYAYDEKEDALRVTVKNKTCSHHEMLTFDFHDYDMKKGSVTCALKWGTRSIPMSIAVDVAATVMSNARNELRNTKGFTWQGWNSAAQYALSNGGDLEEALSMADRSIKGGFGSQATFTNLNTRAAILEKMGKKEEAEKSRTKALALATNGEMNMYAYGLMNQKKFDEAIKIFKMNTDAHPDDSNAWDSLGEGYFTRDAKGDKKLAIKAFKKSLSMNPPENVKKNSMAHLDKLGVQYAKEGHE